MIVEPEIVCPICRRPGGVSGLSRVLERASFRPDLALCSGCYYRRWMPLIRDRLGGLSEAFERHLWPEVEAGPWFFGCLSERGRVLWDEFLESGGEGRPGPI